MATPILATKLFAPPPRANAVARQRLIARMDDGVRSRRKLTLISAPAGFGKTTLLSQWIAATRRREPEVRVAWLSLDASDNDPARFLSYLAAALHSADAAFGSDDAKGPLTVEATLTALVNDVARSPHNVILVLDDFQLIEEASIREAVVFLLERLPSTMHLAIATRSDPLLPLPRLRARDQLTELRAADLRFTAEEATAFLNSVMGLSLTPDDVAALETRTEGWVAGLQLAALSMRERTDVAGFITAFAGSHRFVIDYLVEEVLQRTPPPVREFLNQTAVLDRLSGPLCDAVTGQTGSAEMLESLERGNLFVVPLDDRREWYRYHHLFADVLRSRLLADGPRRMAALHGLASQWYANNGFAEEAVEHALAAPDFAGAARLIEASISGIRKSRRDATLLTWLALLPRDIIRRRPVLGVFSAWSSLVAGDIDAVEPQLAEAQRMLSLVAADGTPAHDSEPSDELRNLPVTIALYRAAVALGRGDLADVQRRAQQAMDLTAPDDHLGRGAAAGLLGLASWARGDIEAGIRAFEQSGASLRLAGNLTDALSTTMVMADMLTPLGRLREIHRAYDAALHEAIEECRGGEPTADLHAGISEVFLQRNELGRALEHLAASEALSERASSHEHRYRWFVAMAGVRRAEGDLDAAVELLAGAEQHYRRGFFPEVRPIGGMRARVLIEQGRLIDAQAWMSEQGLSDTDELTYLREFGHMTLARALIAHHRADPASGALPRAIGLLARLLDAAEAGGRVGSAGEILVLQAVALELQDQTHLALAPLERALDLAEPEGYVRLFLDEGAPMLRLLRAAAGAGIRPAYVRQLSQALRQTEGSGAAGLPVTSALSERELHVVRLLATEMTGPEIARALSVSLNTMRTHTQHIYAKLDVTSRRAAVRRAEAAGLI
jgi:LuxR family maltose regulon positive regulatory protein